MSEYCDGGQLGSIEGQLDSVNARLLITNSRLESVEAKLYGIAEQLEVANDNLDAIVTFLAEFKKNWGEPSWMEAPKGDDKPS